MCGAVGHARQDLDPPRDRPALNPGEPLPLQPGDPFAQKVALRMLNKLTKLAQEQDLGVTRELVAERMCEARPEFRPLLFPDGGSLAA